MVDIYESYKRLDDALNMPMPEEEKPSMPKPPPVLMGKVNKPPVEYSFWYIFGCGFATSSLFWAGVYSIAKYFGGV